MGVQKWLRRTEWVNKIYSPLAKSLLNGKTTIVHLNDSPVVEIVIVGVLVELGHGHAVQLGVGQGVHYVGLQPLRVLQGIVKNQLKKFVRFLKII